jgi:phospholipid/cholesterol/gamma-HCH transport system permease protein
MKMFTQLGEFGYLGYQVALNLRFTMRDRRRLWFQMDHVGVNSVPLVLLVGFFAGAIIAWQGAYQFRGMVSLDVLGGQAARVVVMEMGPVLTALVIAGRIGASMTAEIGTMKVTEQVDALRTMALDPVRYIVLPRFLALSLMLPILTIFANLVGILGSYLVSRYFLDITRQTFFASIKNFLQLQDLTGGMLKALIFGMLISLIGCYKGLSTTGGARGVGHSTISSFVLSAIFILIGDFFLWLILF